jgi:hypothetical protein
VVTPGEVDSPRLLIHLWTTAGEPLGDIVARTTSVTWRHNAIDTASVTVPIDHELAGSLQTTDGVNLAVMEYNGVRFTGWATSAQGESKPIMDEVSGRSAPNGTVTVSLLSDWSLIAAMIAVPVPQSPISDQTASANDNRTGNLELVVKGVIADNALRLGLPLVVMPVRNAGDGDGPQVTISPRMNPMQDVLRPILADANWRVTTRTWFPGDDQPFPGASLNTPMTVVDVVATGTGEVLRWSTSSGQLVTWKYQAQAAGYDRSIVGGAGDGTARTFVEVEDEDRSSIGGPWRFSETFVDSRDVQGNDSMSALLQRGTESNTDGAPTSMIAVEVRDGIPWTFGASGEDTYREGDVATVDLFGTEITDRISAVTVTEDTSLRVVPQIGNASATATADPLLLRAVRRLQTSLAQKAAN